MPGLLPLCQEGEKHDDGWGPSTQPSYHLVRINQSCTLTRWHRARASIAIIEEEHQKKAPWRERKEAYISQKSSTSRMRAFSWRALTSYIMPVAIMFDYDRIGEAIWDRFNAKKEDTLWYYESLLLIV